MFEGVAVASAKLKRHWTHGDRTASEQRHDNAMSWMELCFRNIVGKLGAVVPGDNTRAAEEACGLGASNYYYVGTVHPRFSARVLVFDSYEPDACRARLVPFDTGGLFHGHFHVAPTLSYSEGLALARNVQNDVSAGEAIMDDWLAQAYDDPGEYVRQERPRVPCLKEVPVTRDTNTGAWTWEARIPRVDYQSPPLGICALVWGPGDRLHYADWFVESGLLGSREALEHMRIVETASRDVARRDRVYEESCSLLLG